VAGLITRWPKLKAAAKSMESVVERGAPPGAQLAAWDCFPPAFVALYQTGESTGQLEANLHRLTAQHQEAANRSLALVTLLYPGLMFLGVAGMVVYYVVSIYAGYLKMLTDLAK
jgi:general secretion pathway protein F/type IV pilus assembly protein PilC